MINLIFIIVALALLVGFFALTWYEKSRGVRLYEDKRAKLDKQIARIEFIIEHVDFAAFIRDEVQRAVSSLGHGIVHISLHAVRAVERMLTRLIKEFHAQHTSVDLTPRDNARPFVKTLSDFKSRLKATHPKVLDLQ